PAAPAAGDPMNRTSDEMGNDGNPDWRRFPRHVILGAGREGLFAGLLLIGCIVGLQMSYLLVQAGKLLERTEMEIAVTGAEMRTTLLYSQAVLSSARQTTEIVRRSAEHQMGYYEAVGRRTANLIAEMTFLIRNTEERVEEVTQATNEFLRNEATATAEIAQDFGRVAAQAQGTLAESERLLSDLRQTVAAPEIRGSLEALNASAENLETATAEAAEASRNTAEATGYIRDMLSPTKKSFWRRVLELLIPRPAVSIK
ncbi:MAG: hypothetical protein ACRD88_06820, partial [Terriglobia bacterium]